MHALYGFARYADEIVDGVGGEPRVRAARLARLSRQFLAGLHGEPVEDELLPAVLHTIATLRLGPADFTTFLSSMAMDLQVSEYADYPALLSYMEGSAAVIGTMMLPNLDPAPQRAPTAAWINPPGEPAPLEQLTNSE